MDQLITKLQSLAPQSTGVSSEDLIFAQKALTKFGIGAMPADFVKILHHVNSLNLEGCRLFGVIPEPLNFMDIVNVNVVQKLPDAGDKIILGDNEFDSLVYVHSKQCYQIIDKSDNEVLEEYKSIEPAIYDILKI